MSNNIGQYRYVVLKNGDLIDERAIDDPFIVTTIRSGYSRWAALRAFFTGGIRDEFEIRVNGTPAAHRVVFTGDYTPPEPVAKSDAVGFYEARG